MALPCTGQVLHLPQTATKGSNCTYQMLLRARSWQSPSYPTLLPKYTLTL